jgi:hypothetical protein
MGTLRHQYRAFRADQGDLPLAAQELTVLDVGFTTKLLQKCSSDKFPSGKFAPAWCKTSQPW